MTLSNNKTVLIGGGTGMIGMRLSQILQESGYKVLHLSRKENLNAPFPAFEWDVYKGTINETALENADYVINLAGAGIADKPWSDARKRVIIESRTKSTRLLLDTIQKLGKNQKPLFRAQGLAFMETRGKMGDRK
ncbi:MAG: NAD-dependent epimerase/dehydratase family protein [Saprospiraceae bacterium]|nr:NAD-dependent epimerase/dehydratase family protein [Saprospiraceae bacterium]